MYEISIKYFLLPNQDTDFFLSHFFKGLFGNWYMLCRSVISVILCSSLALGFRSTSCFFLNNILIEISTNFYPTFVRYADNSQLPTSPSSCDLTMTASLPLVIREKDVEYQVRKLILFPGF